MIRLGLHSYRVGWCYSYLNDTDDMKMHNRAESSLAFKTAGEMLMNVPTVQASHLLLQDSNSLHMFWPIKSCLLYVAHFPFMLNNLKPSSSHMLIHHRDTRDVASSGESWFLLLSPAEDCYSPCPSLHNHTVSTFWCPKLISNWFLEHEGDQISTQ